MSIFFIRPEMKLGGALPLFPVSLPLTLSALFSSSLSFQCDLLLTTNYQKKKTKHILEFPVVSHEMLGRQWELMARRFYP